MKVKTTMHIPVKIQAVCYNCDADMRINKEDDEEIEFECSKCDSHVIVVVKKK